MKCWYAIPLLFILFAGVFSDNDAFGAKWLSAKPGDNTLYLIDLVVDPLPRSLENFGLRYLSSNSENAIRVETKAGPVMALFMPHTMNVDLDTGEIIDATVPHKSWIYWLPANKQIGEKVLLDFGPVYGLYNVELTVKEFAIKSFQNQNVNVYLAQGESNGITVSYIVEKSRGVVLEVLVKYGSSSLFDGKLVESNVKMLEATQAPVEETPASVPSPAEEPETQLNISVAMKEKRKLTLLAVKNTDDTPVYAVKIKATDANIKFVKARGWERERVDQNTVIIQTTDKPLAKRTLIVLLIVDKKGSGLEWSALDNMGIQIASGALVPSGTR
ncbi:MAG: hypothetical protein ACE5J2_05645 [Nitrososphaerales archaeon]